MTALKLTTSSSSLADQPPPHLITGDNNRARLKILTVAKDSTLSHVLQFSILYMLMNTKYIYLCVFACVLIYIYTYIYTNI